MLRTSVAAGGPLYCRAHPSGHAAMLPSYHQNNFLSFVTLYSAQQDCPDRRTQQRCGSSRNEDTAWRPLLLCAVLATRITVAAMPYFLAYRLIGNSSVSNAFMAMDTAHLLWLASRAPSGIMPPRKSTGEVASSQELGERNAEA